RTELPRITRVYTRTGDDGTTGLGSGARVPKTAPRIVAYGTVDELNSCIGVVLAAQPHSDLIAPLQRIQNELFQARADLCIPDADKPAHAGPRIETRQVADLESLMDALSEKLEPLANFILPGGTLAAAQLHVARCVCRRAEIEVLRLAAVEPIRGDLVTYLN